MDIVGPILRFHMMEAASRSSSNHRLPANSAKSIAADVPATASNADEYHSAVEDQLSRHSNEEAVYVDLSAERNAPDPSNVTYTPAGMLRGG